jgi:hypothetical protein
MARRQCSRLSADEWAARLDECMAMVLAQPENFDPCVQWWAEWRRHWLATRPKAVSNQGDTPSKSWSLCAGDRPRPPRARQPVLRSGPPAGGTGKTLRRRTNGETQTADNFTAD